METAERIGRLARCVADALPSDKIIGLGSGSTAEAVVRAIAARQAKETGFAITGVPTSVATRDLAISLGIAVRDLSDVARIDLGFDGADEIDPGLNLVKGRGGALLYEKLVAEICDEYWVVSSAEKLVDRLGTRLPLPVEVIPYGWQHTAARIASLGLAPALRGDPEAPFRTDSGNVILDCATGDGVDLLEIRQALKGITGVIEHGIFPGFANRAILVDDQGEVRTVQRA